MKAGNPLPKATTYGMMKEIFAPRTPMSLSPYDRAANFQLLTPLRA
jgi:hypothetical protein